MNYFLTWIITNKVKIPDLGGVKMDITKKVTELLSSQKDILKQYESLIQDLNVDEAINEKLKLEKELTRYREQLEILIKEQANLNEENTSLKLALREQIISEKRNILGVSRKKIDIYFNDEINKKSNKLELLELSAQKKLNKIKEIAEKNLDEGKKEFIIKIDKFNRELEERIASRKEKLQVEKEKILNQIKREYQELKVDEISSEVLERKRKNNDIEVKIGLNWVNKAGVIILLLGIITAMRYTYSTWFNEYMKGISGFVLGALLLGIGEWLTKKDKSLFALGLSGGGIGTLYLSVFSSYFILEIISMPLSILISILVTLVSLVLSQRYKSMTICGLSLIGGYLPFFSYVFSEGLSVEAVYVSMGYLCILNLLVLGISQGRRWVYIKYLSFFLNTPCLIYLTLESPNKIISICYALTIFIMYLAITLVYPMIEKVRLKIYDVILLGLNTFINCMLVYILFDIAEYEGYKGLLALIYAVTYLFLGQLINKTASQEKNIVALFYITSLTFSILIVPFQFGVDWISLGWLIEGLLFISYAVKYKAKKIELSGWIILALCTIGFILIDLPQLWNFEHSVFRYSALTGGFIFVLSLYAKKLKESELFRYTMKGKLLTYYKYFSVINTWIYMMWLITQVYNRYINFDQYDNFYLVVSLALITGLYAYLISKITVLQDKVIKGMSISLYVLIDLLGFSMNFLSIGGDTYTAYKILSIVILILYNIFIFFNIKELIVKLITNRYISIEVYPIPLAIYILGSSTGLLVKQFDLGNINLIISILFIVMSFVYIVLGFKKKYVVLRRFGLGLSIISTGKLFVFDLAFLNTAGKIIAYLCFGLVLIGISYIYHILRNNIEEKKVNMI